MITGLTLTAAIVLGQSGIIITLDDLVDSLILASAGKIILGLIALALIIYGSKNIGWIK